MLICCIRGKDGAAAIGGNERSRRMRALFACVFMLLALAACSSTVEKTNSLAGGNSEAEAKKDTDWSYRERGVVLDVAADPGLNEFGGLAHAVVLVVAQTAEPAAFNTFVKSAPNFGKALGSGEAPGVLSLERIYIEPGSTQRVVLDRVDKARYIGVAAAYFEGDTMRNARLFAIGVDVKTTGMIVKNRVATAQPLGLSVRLGDRAMLYARPAEIAGDALPDKSGEVQAPGAPVAPEPAVRVDPRGGPESRLAAERNGSAAAYDPNTDITDAATSKATNEATKRLLERK